MLEPDDSPDKFLSAALFNRLRKSQVELSLSWSAENLAKLPQKELAEKNVQEDRELATNMAKELVEDIVEQSSRL